MKKNVVKFIGTMAALIGMCATLTADWVNEQKMNDMIDEKVKEAFAERKREEEEP